MVRLFFACLLSILVCPVCAQQYSIATGIYTGFTVPYTIDKGIDTDPRYKSHYSIKSAALGVNFSMDYQDMGFQISPGVYTAGQNYYVVNTMGGQDGNRNIDMKYVLLPASFKYHLIDLSFFRVSAVATGGVAFLYDVKDRISHAYTKLKFPTEVYPILPSDSYKIEYDGVISPPISNVSLSEKKDYKPMQVFGGLGLCSDWNVTEHWRVAFDFRVYYGFLEPRTSTYLEEINNWQRIYDTPGSRTDTFAHFSIGISRYLDFDKADRDRAKNLKGNSRRYTPQKKLKPVHRRK